MALAEATHHTAPRGQKTARARGEERDELYDAMGLMTPPPTRPALLVEVRPQGRVQRHTVEQRIEHTPMVQILDAPVPQNVEQLLEVLRRLDIEVPAQVIEVPKISQDSIRERLVDCDLRHPQMAEQLVEVPTVVSYSSLLQRTVEQHVDIPVPHGRVQGSLPGQSSTTISSGIRVVRTVEQIVDILSPGGSLAHGSSSSAGPADEDFTRVFRTFPRGKKVRVSLRVRVRECLRTRAHGLRALMAW